MKPVRRVIVFTLASIFLLTLGLFAVLFVVSSGDIKDVTYPNLTKAQQEQMIEGGWLPKSTPEDAKNIRLHYDLDSGMVIGSFSSQIPEKVASHCRLAEASVGLHAQRLKWAPREIREAHTAGDLNALGYNIFLCDAEGFVAAIDKARGSAYYWSTGNRLK